MKKIILLSFLLPLLLLAGCSKDEETASSTEQIPSPDPNANQITSQETFTVNGVSFTMIGVHGGTFTMGATSEQGSDVYENELPVHQVTLSDYYIGKYEVTQELWQAVTGDNPSDFIGDLQCPVEMVSYEDVQDFLVSLNRLTGRTFALPTEAQWEFAARGGNGSQHFKYSGSNDMDYAGWYYNNSNNQTHPVGQKQANELGVYDMSGNVWEWCNDWYDSYSSNSQTNPAGPSSGSYRVLRGGCWGHDAGHCRISNRLYGESDYCDELGGFRLVLVP